MRRCLPFLQNVGIGVLLWLVDSLFFSYYNNGVDFTSALWADVPFFRLFLRIAVIILMLAFAAKKSYEIKLDSGSFCPQEAAEKDLFFGSAESGNKSQRLLYHSLRLAGAFKLSAQDMEALRLLCYCYDIGKIAVPFRVLEAKHPLNEADQKIYDEHTSKGAEIARQLPELAPAARLILYHHEFFNGGGVYGQKRYEIPLGCRIFQVVWSFDSMVYPSFAGKALVCDEALLELRYYAGTAFDPEVVEAFVKLMSRNSLLSGLRQREFSLR